MRGVARLPSPAQTPVTFVQPTNIDVCLTLATGDFNGDDNLDAACGESSITSIWLGDGHGHFKQTAQPLPYPAALMVTGNFNGDGRTDLILATYNFYLPTYGQVAFLPGKGDGTFGAQLTISDTAATALASVRPNPNGPLDLVVTVLPEGTSPGLVQLFPGNGDGTFQNPITTGINSTANIAVADFNGDGISDVASSGQLEFGQPL